MLNKEPLWLTEARKYIGLKEIPGAKHEPKILEWWRAIKRGGIKDDETPWCAAFTGGCLEAVGIMSSRFESARSYLEWGQGLTEPRVGCVVVLSRPGYNAGHVGFVVGLDATGKNVAILGGNQGDQVSVAYFDGTRILGYRWPTAVPVPSPERLPVVAAQKSPKES